MIVLIVEDQIPLAKLIIEYLTEEGFECDHAATKQQALTLITAHSYDVIILDVHLPDGSGFDVCRSYRAQGNNTPTIMLTARASLADKSQGFEAGVDDYLVKPFAMEELVMRLTALNQRGKRSDELSVGLLTLNVAQHQACLGQEVLKLSVDEWRLLLLLVSRAGEVVTKDTIMLHMWPDDLATEDALKMLVFRLRKQLKQALRIQNFEENKVEIQTIRSVGLKLVCCP